MRVKVKLMEENGEEDGRWGDGYRFEKVVDEQGDERKEGSRVFLIGWRGEGRGCRTFLSETGKPCSTFFRASALKSRDSFPNIFLSPLLRFTLIIVTFFNYSISVPF